MAFTRWLRQNSEHYLMIDAQRRMAEKYGRPGPPNPQSLAERFWLDVFAPVYRLLPWKLRSFTMQLMPGSHRQQWSRPAERGVPAIGPEGPSGPLSGSEGPSGPLSGSEGPSGPLSGSEGPSGPLSGSTGPPVTAKTGPDTRGE